MIASTFRNRIKKGVRHVASRVLPVSLIRFVVPDRFSINGLPWRETTREEQNKINAVRADSDIVLYDHHGSGNVGAGDEHNEYRHQIISTERVGLWMSYLIFSKGWMLELLKVHDGDEEIRSMQLKYRNTLTDTSGMILEKDIYRVLAKHENAAVDNVRGVYENNQGGRISVVLSFGPNPERSTVQTTLQAQLHNDGVYVTF